MFLGIEIGGTKLQMGLGEGDGSLAGSWRGEVDVAAGPEGIRRQITTASPELLEQARVQRSSLRAAGIGFGGPVDDVTRTVIKSHQIAGWDNFPLAEWVGELVGLPCALGNDADVAGLAEALFGAGKGLSPIFYITVGSGIGGSLILEGEIYRGCGRGAGEIGHLRYPQKAAAARRPVELEASGWAIQERARASARLEPSRAAGLLRLAGGDSSRITARHIAEAAKQTDPLANEILAQRAGSACGRHLRCDRPALPATDRDRRWRLAHGRAIVLSAVARAGGSPSFRPLRGML